MNTLLSKEKIKVFLNEDIGTGDLSAELIFGGARGKGAFIAKEDGIVCGTFVIDAVYSLLGGDHEVRLLKDEGSAVKKGERIAEAEGDIKTLLSGERLILNLMQLMSGIATSAHALVTALDDLSIKITDTRKTHPGLRLFEKYAVTAGGCFNHRMGLYDGVMLKDNHIAFGGGISRTVESVRKKLGHTVKIEVETETREQVAEAVKAGADIIMFDNRTPDEIRELVKLVPKHIITEASGGISLENIHTFKGCGVDIISTGSVTNSAKPLDISFLSEEAIKA